MELSRGDALRRETAQRLLRTYKQLIIVATLNEDQGRKLESARKGTDDANDAVKDLEEKLEEKEYYILHN